MADKFKVKKGLNIQPTSTAPTEKGDLHVDSTTGELKTHDGSTVQKVITDTKTQTLTNKTLDDSTTVIADTSDGTKKIKFDAAGTTATATTILSSQTANRTLTLPDATDTLVGKSTSDVLANKTLTDTTTQIVGTLDNTKRLLLNTSSATTGTYTQVNAAQTADRTITLPDATDTLVGKATTDSLTNKTISGNTNVITVTDSNLTVQDNSDATKQVKLEVSSVTTGTTRTLTVPNASTTIVGTDVAQTLTNKTLGDALTATQISTPSNPSAGFNKIYPKSDGNFYTLNSSGVETQIGSGSGGVKNYLGTVNNINGNGNFELGNTNGFSLFNTTLTSLVPTGSITAGAGSITTFTATSTNKLAGNYSLSVGSSGAMTAGQGFISDAVTLDREDKGRVFSFKINYSVESGTVVQSATSANTFAVYAYDVTNSAWIQPAGVYSMDGSGVISGNFQPPSTCGSLRLAVVCINATGGAVSLLFDDLSLSPNTSSSSAGKAPTVTKILANGTYTPPAGVTSLKITAVGGGGGGGSSSANPGGGSGGGGGGGAAIAFINNISSSYSVTIGGGGGVASSGGTTSFGSVATATGGLGGSSPGASGVGGYGGNGGIGTVGDILLAGNAGGTGSTSLAGTAFGSGGDGGMGASEYGGGGGAGSNAGTGTIGREYGGGGGGACGGAANGAVGAQGIVVVEEFYSGGVSTSEGDGRVVAFTATTSGGSITSGTDVPVAWTVDSDTHSKFSTPYDYIIPVSGYYEVDVEFFMTTTSVAGNDALITKIFKNGSEIATGGRSYWPVRTGGYNSAQFNNTFKFNAGDVIRVVINQSTGTTVSLHTSGNIWSVKRVSGPAAISLSETVSATASTPSGTPANTMTDVTWTVFEDATHSNFSGITYTIPTSGRYEVTGFIEVAMTMVAGDFLQVGISKNGSILRYNISTAGAAQAELGCPIVSGVFKAVAGDTIKIGARATGSSRSWNNAGAGVGAGNFVSIKKVGN